MNEAITQICVSRRLAAWITALMPTLEGLFLATVTDGKRATVQLRYDPRCQRWIRRFLQDLEARFPDEIQVEAEA